MLEGGKSGVVFKWINKEEIMKKYSRKREKFLITSIFE